MVDKNTSQHALQPSPEGAYRSFVRFDIRSSTVSKLPTLKLQAQEITDRGFVRFGSSMITTAR
jgi:hypothetical protein